MLRPITMRVTVRHLLPLWAVLAGLLSGAPALAADGLDAVTLQLKWKHQFQFAGYYVAAEKGYYRNAGFDVRFAEAGGAEDSIATVVGGKADFGVAGSELALRRAQGEPVVALATILQHSALALAVRGGSALSVHDLVGKRIMVSPHDQELFAYLQREGLGGNRVERVPPSFDIQDLIDGRVQGFSVYTTDQVWALRKAGLAHTVLSPRAAGIDFYGDTLFTSEKLARSAPERVQAFRDASLRGWQYAMAHPEETADLILARYSRRLPREHLLFEAAEMTRLMQPQLIEVGHMNPGRWHHIAEVYAEIGMLPRSFSLDGFLFGGQPGGAVRLSPWLLASALLVLLGGAAAWLAWKNRQLRLALRAGPPVPASVGGAQPNRDAPTGLYSPHYLDDTLPRELLRAQRDGAPLSVALLQVNGLDQVARSDGAAAADALLHALAAMVQAQLQPGDFACRLDGATLAWVMPGQAQGDAVQRVQQLRQAFAGQTHWAGLIELRGTAAGGVAAFPQDGSTAAALLIQARAALQA